MLKMILGAIFGNLGGAAAGAVSKTVEIGAIIAVAAPLALWWNAGGKDEILVSFELTYAQAVCLGLLFLWTARVLRRSEPPAPRHDPYS